MSRVYSGCDWVCAACTFENSLRKSSCEVGTGGPNIAESFLAKKFGDIGTFGDIGHFRRYGNKNKFFRSKNEKRVGVGNDVICQTIFQFYKEFHDRFE